QLKSILILFKPPAPLPPLMESLILDRSPHQEVGRCYLLLFVTGFYERRSQSPRREPVVSSVKLMSSL
ncbi:hypothetical protein PIB30_103814, partial [Stylosanthes scabra]|nr:hypothetical protein [Stylosanthes scabra]